MKTRNDLSAYNFAKEKHQGQYRNDGKEYFTHIEAKDDERKLISTATNDEERKEFRMNVFRNYEELGYKLTKIKIEQ